MKKFLAVFILMIMLLPATALAQNGAETDTGVVSPCAGEDLKIGECVSGIYLWALGVAGVLALVMMILGGYKVMTSSGNAQAASDGKSYILSSLIGLAILLGAYLLLSTINPDLTNLDFQFDLDATSEQTGQETGN